jgi:hypothetical protein
MSKTRDTGFLGNVIKVDASGNVSFVSGSTTLATINTSGQMSGSSPVLSSSYALNADLLDGLDSTQFTLTSSFAAQTASFTAFTASINAQTASINAFSASQNSFTASILAQTASLNTFSASVLTYQTNLNLKTASFATTGSNNFTAVQRITDTTNPTGFDTTASLYTEGGFGIKKDTYISSSLYIKGNLTVYGTQSVNYITSSQLNISTNIITVNTSTPSIRFGGLAVIDSGSVGGLTGSLLWDSQNNTWIYTNPSGGLYDGGMLLMGPPNYSASGNEVGISTNALAKGAGSHHMTSSGIFESGSNVGIGVSSPSAKLHINGSSGSPTYRGFVYTYAGNETLTDEILFQAVVDGYTSVYPLYLFRDQRTTQTSTQRIFEIQGGISGVGTILTTLANGNVGIGTTSPAEKLHVSGGAIKVQGDTAANTANAAALSYASGYASLNSWGSNTSTWGGIKFILNASNGNAITAMTISGSGNVGIGTTSPQASLHIEGKANTTALTIGASNGYEIFITGSDSANIYHASPNQDIYLNTNGGALYLGTSAASTLLTITGSNVGIGTTSPNSLLQAGSTAVSSGGGSLRVYGYDGAADFYTTRQESDWNAALYLHNNPSGVVGNGTGIIFRARSSSTDSRVQGAVYTSWTTSTDASRTSKLVLQTVDSGTTSDKVTILGNGNVGIGTTSPTVKLDIRGGNFLLKGDVTDGGILTITRRYSTGAQTLNFNNNHPSTNLDWTGARITSADAGNYNGYLDFAVSLGSNNSEAAGTAAVASVMRLTKDGNVGIGTTSPARKLIIYGGTTNAGLEILSANGYRTAIIAGGASSGTGADQGYFQMTDQGTAKVVLNTAGDSYLTGGSLGVGLSNPLATLATLGGAVQIMGDYRNHATVIRSAGANGTFNGSLVITIPEMSTASTDGYGGYSCEVYVAGYSGFYCHAWFGGYINGGIVASEATILRSNGGWSISQTSYGTSNQGFQFTIDYPSSIVHPTARVIFNKGGSPNSTAYPANSITTTFS